MVLYTTHNWAAAASASLSDFLLTQHFWQSSHGNRSIDELPQRASACISVQNVDADLNAKLDVDTCGSLHSAALALDGVMPRACHLQESSAHLRSRTWHMLILDTQCRLVRYDIPPNVPRGRCLEQFIQKHLVCFVERKKKKNLHVLTELHFVGSNFLHGSCSSGQISKCTAAMSWI